MRDSVDSGISVVEIPPDASPDASPEASPEANAVTESKSMHARNNAVIRFMILSSSVVLL